MDKVIKRHIFWVDTNAIFSSISPTNYGFTLKFEGISIIVSTYVGLVFKVSEILLLDNKIYL